MVRRGVSLILLSVTAVAFVIGSGMAAADAASLEPTDWRSTLVSVAPASDLVRVEVFEGGEAVRVVVEPGHTLTIPGYANEPYLRVTADGTVEANLRSPTWWSNRSTTGDAPVPDSADASAAPEWKRIGSGGALTWHDHRVHAMPGMEGISAANATDWTVTFDVDGLPHVARGRLSRVPSHSPVPEIVIGVAVAIGVVIVGRRRARSVTSSAVLAGTGLATVLAIGEAVSTPAGMDVPTLHLGTAIASLTLALLATLLRDRTRRTSMVVLVASIAVVSWWWVLLLPTMTAAIVPNAFADPIVRFGLAVIAGLIIAAATLLVWSGAFADDSERSAPGVDPGRADTTQLGDGTDS